MKYENEILNERDSTHGDWTQTSLLAQDLKQSLRLYEVYMAVPPRRREALDLICTKIARIVCGRSDISEHWDDIAGYAQLAASDIPKE